MKVDHEQLIELAKSTSDKAYAPYSKFKVGCAVVSERGNIYTACNVENISFGLTICAERAAIFKAVADEGPDFRIERVVIYTPTNKPISPCGACRQVLHEFGDDFEVTCVCEGQDRIVMNINELLPKTPEIKINTGQ